jgi:hypothetical protein
MLTLTIQASAALGDHPRAGSAVAVSPHDVSSPRKRRANRKVPDVCMTMGVASITDYDLWRVLDFRIE